MDKPGTEQKGTEGPGREAGDLDRLQVVLPMASVLLGFGKAPVFALLIGLIGCYMGLKVENNARSVGLNTTSTVVQSIVVVIILNAAFAVIFARVGM